MNDQAIVPKMEGVKLKGDKKNHASIARRSAFVEQIEQFEHLNLRNRKSLKFRVVVMKQTGLLGGFGHDEFFNGFIQTY